MVKYRSNCTTHVFKGLAGISPCCNKRKPDSLFLQRIRMDKHISCIVHALTVWENYVWMLSDRQRRKTACMVSLVNTDLSRLFLFSFFQPIGALNPKRAAFYAERYETWDDDSTPPHHYTTLYSTAHSTLMWMLRIVSTYFTHLQPFKHQQPFEEYARDPSSL